MEVQREMAEVFIRLSGIFNVASGLTLVAFWYLYAVLLPYRKLSSTLAILAVHRHWTWVNVLGVSGALLGLLGQGGLYMSQMDHVGWPGLIGYLVATAGTALLLAPLLWDTVLWPALAGHDPHLLDFQGPIYRSTSFVPYFMIAGLTYSLGYVVVGIVTARAGVLPAIGGTLLAIGAPLFGLGAALGRLQVIARSLGVTLLGLGLLRLGLALWSLA
jgi:hypothetical protein